MGSGACSDCAEVSLMCDMQRERERERERERDPHLCALLRLCSGEFDVCAAAADARFCMYWWMIHVHALTNTLKQAHLH